MAKTDAEKEKEAGQIAECVEVLAVFAQINPRGEKIAHQSKEGDDSGQATFSGVYNIRRSGRQVQITSADLVAAAKVCNNRAAATLDECRKTLKPFAKLNEDPRVEDPNSPILAFPGVDGKPVPITNAMIGKIRDLYESIS